MRKSFLIFKKCTRFIVIAIFSLVLTFCTANFALANDWTFTDNFGSYNPGDLGEQGGWAVTNYYGNPDNPANVSTTDASKGTKYVEITNHGSLITTHDITPITTGIFQFRMRHNKSGLFYFYALTSDQGGQLLFSIQFTESRGILLEEADKQITLLPDYNADQWYLFTIDFDHSRGEHGTFKIKIDGGDYSEYPYVNSGSAIFDFAQMVFGSDSDGVFGSVSNVTANSAFGDIQSTPSLPATIDIIDDGAIPDPNFIPNTPSPNPAPVDSTSTPEVTPAPVIQQNEDGSIDIIDSGAIPDTAITTETAPATATDTATPTPEPEPVIQENGDGSTTIIAI